MKAENKSWSWPTTTIAKSAYLRGRIGWQGLKASEFLEDGPFLITGTDFNDGRINWDHCYHVSEARFAEAGYIHLKNSDVLITKDGTIGKVALVEDCPEKAVLNSGIFLLRCNDGSFDHGYIFHLLKSNSFRKFLDDNLAGSTIQHLYQHVFKTFEFPLPDLREQVTIAKILSTVDQAIENARRLIAKHQRIKAGLMQDLLSRGIDEHGNVRKEETHEFKDSPLGRVPVEWAMTHLEEIAEFVTSGSRGWAQYYSLDGPIFLRIGNLTRNHINLRLEDTVRVNPPLSSEGKRTAVSVGDLLISITADLGVIGVIPAGFGEAYVNQHIALARLVPEKVNPRFIGWFLSGHRGQIQFDKLNESGAKAGLNLPTVRRLLVPVMDRSEQTRIAEILDASTQEMNEQYMRLKKLLSLKAGLMQDVLTGKKRVTGLLEPKPKREKVYAGSR